MTLAFDREGRLLAGTESPGRVFRIDAAGKPFVLLDSSYNEIRTLRVDAAGNIYAAAVSGRPRPAALRRRRRPTRRPRGALIATVSTEVTVIAVVGECRSAGGSTQAPPPPHRAAPRPARSSASPRRRLGPGVGIARGHAVRHRLRERRHVLVATGNKGKIYRLSGDPLQPTLVARANAQQVTTLLPDRDGRMLFATSNPGKLLRLSAARADRGTYTSDVRDAQTVATWGTIKWQAAAPSRHARRDRHALGQHADARRDVERLERRLHRRRRQRRSPARARATCSGGRCSTAARGESPLLTSVTAAYLPRNMRPRVTSITIHPPGTVFQRPFPTDPEIAGFDGDIAGSPCRRRRPQGGAGARRRSAAAPTRRGC